MVTLNNNKKILLLWGDHKDRQTVFKVLSATGAEVQHAGPDDSQEVIDNRYRLVVIDYDSVRDEADELLRRISQEKARPAVLVVTATRDKGDLIRLMSHEVLTNLVAKNTDVTANEMVVTVQKIMRNDIFGIEKYLTWGVHAYEEVVSSSERKDPLLNQLEEYLNSVGCNKRLTNLARGVGDEFFMNAVYNAPVGPDGKTKYATWSRTQPVTLTNGEEVKFRYASDGRVLALSVIDNFGMLERSTVLSYLRKCFMRGDDQIDDKQGGAGLGLFYIFESLNQFIINVSPKRCTEMIGIMDISGTYKDFAVRPKSLNIFLQEERP